LASQLSKDQIMASTEPFIGEIGMFGSFVPNGWFPCDGRTLQIRDASMLFVVIGNRFGGDGTTNFMLPNLNGRVPVGAGTAPGLDPVAVGAIFGSDTVRLTRDQVAHSHALVRKGATSAAQKTNAITPTTNLGQLLVSKDGGTTNWDRVPHFAPPSALNALLNAATIGLSGGGASLDNRQPYVALNFGIAHQGHIPNPQ
jgi:microcystin-dependent protein